MFIKMLTLQAGPQGTREAGQFYDVPDKEAKALIKDGYAVQAPREAPAERATGRGGRERAAAKNEEAAKTLPDDSANDSKAR